MPNDRDRSRIYKGKRMVGAALPADDPRKAGISRGVFLTSDGPAYRVPDHLEQHATSVAEIVRRLHMVRAGLDADSKARRR